MDATRVADGSGEGNWEIPGSIGADKIRFIIDDTPPTVLITTPTAVALNAISQIDGTANADIAGFNVTKIRISTGSGASTMYWNGSGWVSSADTWLNSTKLGPTSWYYSVDGAMLEDDVQYTVSARALDWAGNYSSVYSTYTFTYDITAPNASIDYPLDGETYSQVLVSTPITGTTTNTQSSANTGVSTVTVQITDIDASQCFDGGVFGGCPFWLPAQGTVDNWSYNDSDLSFVNDHRYKFEAKARDIAGNESSVASAQISFDLNKPTSTVTEPLQEYVSELTAVYGQVSDDIDSSFNYEAKVGTYTLKVAMKLRYGGWWNGSDAFDAVNPSWFEAQIDTGPYGSGANVVDWSYNLPSSMQGVIGGLGTTDYIAVPWSWDLAQNKEFGPNTGEPSAADIPPNVGKIIHYDNEVPVAVTTTPANNSYINALSITPLYGTAYDAGKIRDVHVLVKADYSNAVWKGTYLNTSEDWDDTSSKYVYWTTATYNNGEWNITLPSLDPVNNNKIYIWVRAVDEAGNWGPTPSNAQIDNNLNADDSDAYYFTYDNSDPVTGVIIPDNWALANSTGLVRGTSYDGSPQPSGVSEIRIKLERSDGSFWDFINSNWSGASDNTYSTLGIDPWEKSFSESALEDGYQYDFYSFAKDYALNNTDGAYFSTFTFIVDMTTPTSKVTFPADNSFLGNVTAIEGTADDSVENINNWASPRNFESGISTSATSVEVAIQRLSDDLWWDGSGFNSASRVWNAASFDGASSGTWLYSLSAGAIADGTTYYTMSRVADIVGNIQTQYTTNYFTGDTTPPSSKATFPSGTVSSVDSISGTAQDTLPGRIGYSRIRLRSLYIERYVRTVRAGIRCFISSLIHGYCLHFVLTFVYPAYGGRIPGPIGRLTFNIVGSGGSYPNSVIRIRSSGACDKIGAVKTLRRTRAGNLLNRNLNHLAVLQFPGPDDRNYKASDVLTISGNGTNLRATDSVEIHVKRLKEPASWWYEPDKVWVDFDTYTFVSESGGTWAQSIDGNAAFTVDNASYTITVIGYNSSNEAEDPPTIRRIVIDNTVPVGAILNPSTYYVNVMPTITGTATDPDNITQPSLNKAEGGNVYVRIKDINDGTYWNGGKFEVLMSSSNIETEYDVATVVSWSTAT